MVNTNDNSSIKIWVRSIGKSGFFGFPFYRSIGKSEKGFSKLFSWTAVFFLLIMRARTRPLFLTTVFKSLCGFPNRTVKMKIQKQISQRWNPFSDFAFDPDFPIELTQCVTRTFDVLVLQNGIVVVQNNGKERQKKRAARANLFLLIRKKSVLHVQICIFAN